MSLTRKHYEAFAERFQQQLNELDNLQAAAHDAGKITVGEWVVARGQLEQLAAKFALTFGWDNPRFDKLRFLKACGF